MPFTSGLWLYRFQESGSCSYKWPWPEILKEQKAHWIWNLMRWQVKYSSSSRSSVLSSCIVQSSSFQPWFIISTFEENAFSNHITVLQQGACVWLWHKAWKSSLTLFNLFLQIHEWLVFLSLCVVDLGWNHFPLPLLCSSWPCLHLSTWIAMIPCLSVSLSPSLPGAPGCHSTLPVTSNLCQSVTILPRVTVSLFPLASQLPSQFCLLSALEHTTHALTCEFRLTFFAWHGPTQGSCLTPFSRLSTSFVSPKDVLDCQRCHAMQLCLQSSHPKWLTCMCMSMYVEWQHPTARIFFTVFFLAPWREPGT